MKPKIMVGIPTYHGKEYCLTELIKTIRAFTYDNFEVVFCESSFGPAFFEQIKKEMPEAIVLKSSFIPKPKENLVSCRNKLRDYFLKGDYDYFLSLEADNFPPPDVIERLLAHNKLVVGGWYNCKVGVTKHLKGYDLPCINMKSMYESSNRSFEGFYEAKGLIKVHLIGLGCLLIKRDVIEKIEFSVNRPFYTNSISNKWFDDVWFVIDCNNLGIDVWCDKLLYIRHDSKRALDTREVNVWR